MASQQIKVAILGAGWPGVKHAQGYRDTGGFAIPAVADLIPARRQAIMRDFGATTEFSSAEQLLKEAQGIDAVSICLPNDLHVPIAIAALKSGKHVLCETPPALGANELKKLQSVASKAKKVLLFAAQRRFGGPEQAAQQAIAKGYAGEVFHARASWMRTQGIPGGTGWYLDPERSGGGALIDLGYPMLDLCWSLLGKPTAQTVFGATSTRGMNARRVLPAQQIGDTARHDDQSDGTGPSGTSSGSRSARSTRNVEGLATALITFEGGKTLELATSWAINQSPRHQGTVCRLHGEKGAIDVYTPHGPLLYRGFDPKGQAKQTPLKLPKIVQYHALMRHFKECIAGRATPQTDVEDAQSVMRIIDAIYRSAQSGKSVNV